MDTSVPKRFGLIRTRVWMRAWSGQHKRSHIRSPQTVRRALDTSRQLPTRPHNECGCGACRYTVAGVGAMMLHMVGPEPIVPERLVTVCDLLLSSAEQEIARLNDQGSRRRRFHAITANTGRHSPRSVSTWRSRAPVPSVRALCEPTRESSA